MLLMPFTLYNFKCWVQQIQQHFNTNNKWIIGFIMFWKLISRLFILGFFYWTFNMMIMMHIFTKFSSYSCSVVCLLMLLLLLISPTKKACWILFFLLSNSGIKTATLLKCVFLGRFFCVFLGKNKTFSISFPIKINRK